MDEEGRYMDSIESRSIQSGEGRVIMIVVSQADDVATHLGGTVRLWSEARWRVVCVRVTDDAIDFGSGCAGLDTDRTADLKTDLDAARLANRQEFRQAAAILGVTEIVDLDLPAGHLGDIAATELRGLIVREIRRHRPYALVTYDPKAVGVGDDMDRASVARAVDQAFGASQNPALHLEYEGLHGCFERWYMGPGVVNPTHHVDITTVIEHKLTAALCHRTKLAGFVDQLAMQARTGGYQLKILDEIQAGGSVRPLIETLLKAHGATVGKRHAVEFAEEFRIVTFGGLGALIDWFGRPTES
jgi:LmbE family N-acetylglucosaminyl deacetylase